MMDGAPLAGGADDEAEVEPPPHPASVRVRISASVRINDEGTTAEA